MNLLNNYYNFSEKDLVWIPQITDPVAVKLSNEKYELKIKKNKTIKNDYLKKLGSSNKIIKNYNDLLTKRGKLTGNTNTGNFHYWVLYNYIYPYTLLLTNENNLHNLRKFRNLNKKKNSDIEMQLSIQKYIIKKSNEINIYHYQTMTSYRLYYIFEKFKILDINKSLNTLFLFQLTDLLQIEDYFLFRENSSNSYITDSVDVVKIFDADNRNINRIEKIKKLEKAFKFNYINISENFCKDNFYPQKKYDFICAGGYIYNFEHKYKLETINAQQTFNKIILILKNLNKGGSALLYIGDSFAQITLDMINILSYHFYDIYLLKSPLQNPMRPYKYIVLINYKGISKKKLGDLESIRTDWYKYNTTCGLPWENNYKYYFNSILKKNSKKLENEICIFNLCDNQKKLNIINNIFKTFNKIKNSPTKNDTLDIIHHIIDNNIITAKKMLINLDIPLKSNISNYYVYDILINNPILYCFYNTNYVLDNKILKVDSLSKKVLKNAKKNLLYIKRSIDTRNNKLYNRLTYNIKILKDIKQYISNKLNIKISQAFLKMWEILYITKIIPFNNKIFKSFSLCEAPGQFILGINYYLKTKTKNKDYIWYANSLNPKKRKDGFGDNYGLIKNYPDKWLFGKDNSGDITNIENIKYIKNQLPNDLNLITSDCGQAIKDTREFNYQEKNMAYLNVSQIRAILYLLPINGNAIFKTFLPMILSINISLLYILYITFDKVYAYKPQQNPGSSEIYIICNDFKGIDQNILNKLFDINSKNILINKFIIPVSQKFIYIYSDIITKLMNKNKKSIERSLSIYDELLKTNYYNKYLEILDKDTMKILHNWEKTFGFKFVKNKIMKFTS